MRTHRCLIVLFTSLLMLTGNAQGQQSSDGPSLYNIFSLSVEVTTEVGNDLMRANLVVQARNQDASVLSDQINETMAWALKQLEGFPTLKLETRDYQTFPRYDTSQARRLIGWRATQILQIETDDFPAASEAIQILQERLQVQGMQLTAKQAARQGAADLLINDALQAFKQRAELVQKNMGAATYRVVDVDIQTDNQFNPVMHRSEMSMRSNDARISAPSIEGGSSLVSVRLAGRIQLN